jgi:hypothetical protein
LLIAFAVLIGGAAVAVLLRIHQINQPLLPASVQRQLSFSPLALSRTGDFRADTYKYDPTTDILSFKVYGYDNKQIVIAEQMLPSQFTEISGYQDQFLQNVIQQTETVQTSNGTVYLGHPSKQPAQQVAVIIGRGLLVFMTPQDSTTLSVGEWRALAEQLDIQKIL